MTQHEYVFVAISIVLGLAITRLLAAAAALLRAHRRIRFHWSTSLWALCVFVFILQMWWVGWELRDVTQWRILDFFVLVTAAVFIYGAAELTLPVEDYDIASDRELDFLNHSRTLGRASAASMFGYFLVGPYVNIVLFENPAGPSIAVAALGALQMALVVLRPSLFPPLSVVFALYAVLVLLLTA